VQRLIGKYPHLAPDDIVRVVRMVHAGFDQSSIRDFVPLLVERKARAELAKGGPALAAN
jgi:hypothetical protein